jgi:ring-1,2-phenylacetyl-CoA epoxidase subunit PaaC
MPVMREEQKTQLIRYVTYLADNNLILGHRLSEWCGHGPVLEQDIALSNIALDLIGQARMYYQYAAELMGKGHTEDSIAYLRLEHDYRNVLLVERPNGDFADTIARQFIYDSYHYYFLEALKNSADQRLADIAEKSIKEVAYHKRYSSEWLTRLGDGTEESHRRIQNAIDELWKYSNELVTPATWESELIKAGIAPDVSTYSNAMSSFGKEICRTAKVVIPDIAYFQHGGKSGRHTEAMGFILAELQYIQRAYPGLEW